MISKDSVVVATREQVSSNLGDEVVILNLAKGIYYGMDSVGARVWELVQEPQPVAALHATLLEEYDVDPESCERDLLALLQQMAEEGLIEIHAGPVASHASPSPAAGA